MKRHLHLLMIGLVLLISGQLQGQAPFFQETKAEADVLQLSNGTPQNAVMNHFIQAMAKASNKGVDNIRFVVAYERSLQLAA